MKKLNSIALIFVFVLITGACNNDNDIDTEKPLIDISFAEAFPTNCDTLYFGETFIVKMRFSDNIELGSYSIDIHNNFDGHSHSTEVSQCISDPVKEPVNPYVFIDDYSIPDGSFEFETNLSVSVPNGNDAGQFDEGDYHFYISLTDKEGWQIHKGLSIKMLHR